MSLRAEISGAQQLQSSAIASLGDVIPIQIMFATDKFFVGNIYNLLVYQISYRCRALNHVSRSFFKMVLRVKRWRNAI
ncbi:hypothetical protein NIES37_20760 [Tolypothrix tenuis PCC 7101]|uniref:Uncharacterized protein n=1 Tax=Tolypothrix tenuis PCC 7101 TaxID=231146 RepID=A0A1Z4MXG3_9CYAN|nr:hypothetical protein NIES37_20760 [Tolypothrix tenuis PCC 7101]BAZ77953.1 hypothetical protein NIES50_65860 [Aulosira laxa NIES-50]